MDWFSDQFQTLSFAEMIVRLVAAAVLTGVLGFEREASGKSAGLRTNVLVALGACAFVLAVAQAPAVLDVGEETLDYDPTRFVDAVATGIGFLGAGAIFRGGAGVHGLTTGATIWIAGAVGVACGVGQIVLAACVIALAIATLVGLGFLEDRVFGDE